MNIVILEEGCKPTYAHEDDGAMDCRASSDCVWKYNGLAFTCEVSLGFKVSVPRDYVLLLFGRSGMGFKHLTSLVNSVGVIDCGYINEVKAKLISFNNNNFSPNIKKGDKVCQMILMYRPKIFLDEVKELDETERGLNGFGSTGA